MQEVLPLFSTPIYTNDLGKPKQEWIDHVHSLPYHRVSSDNGFATDDTYILEHPEYADLKAIIMNEIMFYATDVLGVDTSNIEFYITNSWSNIHFSNDIAHWHHHGNSLISGIYYIDVPEGDSGEIRFQDLRDRIFPTALELPQSHYNIYNCQSYGWKPHNGQLVLFPSHLQHATSHNNTEQGRYCIPFNVFVRGSWGEGISENVGMITIK